MDLFRAYLEKAFELVVNDGGDQAHQAVNTDENIDNEKYWCKSVLWVCLYHYIRIVRSGQ